MPRDDRNRSGDHFFSHCREARKLLDRVTGVTGRSAVKPRSVLLAACILIALWWAAAAATGRGFIVSPLSAAEVMLKETVSGVLPLHLGVSLLRIAAALIFAFIPALILGILSGRVAGADRIISPAVYLLFPVPKIALLPIILLFLGLGNVSKIFFVSLIIFFQIFLEIRDGTAGINLRYFDSLYTLGGNKKHALLHVILPAVLPRIFSALRLSVGTAFAVLFLAETFATRLGIGWYIMDSWSRIAYTRMYAGILALSLSGIVIFGLLDVLERRLCRWKK